MKIGIVTAGGDAPGMNAAIRAITRIACFNGCKVIGFERGWEGVMNNKFRELTPRSVGGIVHLGGTILHTSRSQKFKEAEGIKKAAESLDKNDLDGLIVIGGNGSFKGAYELSKKTDTSIIGIPATIDNDVFGTDETIGFDTAVNTAVSEIDKIRDTAVSHERIFLVEVMGGKRGFLAASVGLAVGAELILVPEIRCEKDEVIKTIKENMAKGKKAGIIVVAEGYGDTRKLAEEVAKGTGSEVRISVLGYSQRGGSPTARSRMLANFFSQKAVELLLNGKKSSIVCLQDGKIKNIDLKKTVSNEKPLDKNLIKLSKILSY